MFNIEHLSKSVVNFNLIMMFKPKYIVILTCLFCSIVAGGTSHFYSFFFRKHFGKGLFLGMTTLAFGLASQAQAKNDVLLTSMRRDQVDAT